MSDGTADPGLVGGALAAHLEANRATINHEVATAARQSSRFDPAAFGAVLHTTVAPIVTAVEAHGDGFADLVSRTLVSVALDLSAQERFEGAVRDGWDRLLPALAPLLAVDGPRVIAAVTNALDTLARTGGARPAQWIDLMRAVAPSAGDPDALLAAGQVAAWRSGMAAYRAGALDVASRLDPALAATALGMPGEGWEAADFLAAVRADPWFDPDAARLEADAGSAPVAGPTERPPVAVGAFRGFGGSFLRPPAIVEAGEGVGDPVLVSDGEDRFAVFADAFGSAVVRVPDPGGGSGAGAARVAVEAPPPELADIPEVTGWAVVASGHVATSALTHAVLFTRPRR